MTIHKILLISCLFLGFSSSDLHAQTTRFLIKAGIGYSDMLASKQHTSLSFDFKGRLANQAGIGVRRQFTTSSGLQAELLQISKRVSVSSDDSLSINFNSVGLALLYLYKPLSFLELEVGALPNYTFSIKNNYGRDLGSVWQNWQFDTALVVGMRILIGNNFAINPRLNYGLIQPKVDLYYSNDGVNYTITENRYNHVYGMISFEYLFRLPKKN